MWLSACWAHCKTTACKPISGQWRASKDHHNTERTYWLPVALCLPVARNLDLRNERTAWYDPMITSQKIPSNLMIILMIKLYHCCQKSTMFIHLQNFMLRQGRES